MKLLPTGLRLDDCPAPLPHEPLTQFKRYVMERWEPLPRVGDTYAWYKGEPPGGWMRLETDIKVTAVYLLDGRWAVACFCCDNQSKAVYKSDLWHEMVRTGQIAKAFNADSFAKAALADMVVSFRRAPYRVESELKFRMIKTRENTGVRNLLRFQEGGVEAPVHAARRAGGRREG